MKIESSYVSMDGYSQSNTKTSVQVTNATVSSSSRLDMTTEQANNRLAEGKVDSLFRMMYVSEEGRALSSKLRSGNNEEDPGQNENEDTSQTTQQKSVPKWNVQSIPLSKRPEGFQIEIKSREELRRELLERLISSMWGKGRNVRIPSIYDKLNIGKDQGKMISDTAWTSQAQGQSQAQALESGLVTYVSNIQKTSVEISEKESMSFSSQISVKTADGRNINVNLDLSLSRELYYKMESTSVTETMQRLCDPLVVNFGASSAELSDMKFSFDLDCDGKSDQISQLAKGSGFLALDLNSDGAINDGSELFGAKSGNGFADLAKYDADGNGWIDESDEIFDKLRIWTKDDDGKDTLLSLGEVGIGAVYLGYVNTDYSLKSGSDLNGMIRKTGIFLNEDGTAGTIQHVDLAI